MDKIGKVSQWVFYLGDTRLVVNHHTLIMTWVVISLTLLFAWLATRSRKMVPGPWQMIAELLVDWFKELVRDALGEAYEERYFPLICALFIFLLLCNWIGIVPGLEEPTKDLNNQGQGTERVCQRILRTDVFSGAPERGGRNSQSDFHLLPFIWQHNGRQHYYYCGFPSNLGTAAAAFPVCFFCFICGHGASIRLHDAHIGIYLSAN
jgi:hypothetical protein